LKRRPFVRPLLASAAIAAALLLAGCDTDGVSPSLRSLQPLSATMVTEIEQKNMSKESPILVRLYKEESELEVWKEDRNGDFALLKTYPICRWSGELGPKIKQGDRQAPEGFYTITPGLMNPNSSYYLAINIGFPNKYDQANGRTGQFLMIHGDCSSAGCYAMTDEQIGEIYALARESFFGGQRSFQIQAYPFRMTPLNMAKHRNSPHMAFWKMLKQGNDHFEVTKREPRVEVCDKHYVFDAETNGKFSPAGACPAYQVNQEVAAAVAEKQKRDEREMAEYVNKGTPTVAVVTHTDGGMHPKFLAAFQKPSGDASAVTRSPFVSTPGTIPAHAVPPREAEPAAASFGNQSSTSRVASATDSGPSGNWFGSMFSSNGTEQPSASEGGVLDRMSRFVGLKGSDPAPEATTAAAQKKKSTPPPKATQTAAATPKTATPKSASPSSGPALAGTSSAAPTNAGAIRPATPKAQPQQANAETKPEASQEAKAAPEARPANSAGLLNGAQPTVPTGSFSSRWGSFQ
jgi:murein L,D-transpeptidase YafK